MNKMDKIKQDVLKIAYGIAKDSVDYPEKIKIDSAHTSNSLDGCITENGNVIKNGENHFSVYIRYQSVCVCMVKFEAETLIPKYVSIGKGIKGKKEFYRYKITDVEQIKNYTDKIQTHLKNILY